MSEPNVFVIPIHHVSGVKYALVDAEYAEEVQRLKWRYHTKGYARSSPRKNGERTDIFLHHFILSLAKVDRPRGMETDHINRNGLDNRLENLRVVTREQNQANRSRSGCNPYRGVVKCHNPRRRKKWRASIKRNGAKIHLGFFSTAEEAALAYDQAARSHGGVYILNFPAL